MRFVVITWLYVYIYIYILYKFKILYKNLWKLLFVIDLFIRILICILFLDIIEIFKTKTSVWMPKTQYASLIHIIIINEIFGLHIFESKKRLRYSWSVIYSFICIILYAAFLYEIIIQNYKNWPAYEVLSFKMISFISIICVMIFVIFGMMNTEVSIFKTIIVYDI